MATTAQPACCDDRDVPNYIGGDGGSASAGGNPAAANGTSAVGSAQRLSRAARPRISSDRLDTKMVPRGGIEPPTP